MTSKRLEVFLSGDDERMLLDALRSKLSWMVVLETTKGGRDLYVRNDFESPTQAYLPTAPLGAGPIDLRSLPPLIQVLRSGVFPSHVMPGKPEMRQGRLAIVYERAGEPVELTVKTVWSVAKKLCSANVVGFNPVSNICLGPVTGIWIGPGAAEWSRDGKLLASNAANVFYAPADQFPGS